MTAQATGPGAAQDSPGDERRSLLKRYSSHLEAQGYRIRTQRAYVASAEHFLECLSTEPNDSLRVTRAAVRIFLEVHLPGCQCPQAGHRDVQMVRAALNQFLLMQGEERLRAVRDATASDEIEASVRDFDRHLCDVCGLAEATRWYHRRHARAFLRWLFAERPVVFAEITPGVLVRFVTERAEGHRPGSIGVLVYSLRAYLRFLAFHCAVSASLTATIPRPPNWSLAGLPPSLDPTDLKRFLAAFDRSRPTGKRDYAMARCLADLGLRCCEVAGLTLDAIDWRNGIVRLAKTKAHREDALPIPEPTGQALADYLCDGRPTTLNRAVFVYHRPPKDHAVQASTVRGAIRRAFARAGLPWTGTHILRHTMATRLFQHGSSLKEIADVLRHRSLDTTQLYTKVDLPRLFQVALPWPGRSS